MDNNVESHELPEIFIGDTQHVGIVGSIIEGWVHVWNSSGTIAVMEDEGSDSGDLGAEIKSILESWLPIFSLMDSILVGLSELASWLTSQNTCGKLSHWMHGLWE